MSRGCNLSQKTTATVAAHPSYIDGEPNDISYTDVAWFIEESSTQHHSPQLGDLDATVLATANEVPHGEGSHDKRWVLEIDGQAFDVQRRASPDAANINVQHVRPVDVT
jgi:hypothetical protein